MPRKAAPRLYPLEPLLKMARRYPLTSRHGAGYGPLIEVCRLSGSELQHARLHGLTDAQADRCAMRLGYHPAEVWGEEWWDGVEARDRMDIVFAGLKRFSTHTLRTMR